MKKITTLFTLSLMTFTSGAWAQGPETKTVTQSEFYDLKDPITQLSEIQEGQYYIFHNRNRNCHVYEAAGGQMRMGLPGKLTTQTVGDASYAWKASLTSPVENVEQAGETPTTLYSFSAASGRYVPVIDKSGNIVTTDSEHRGRFLIKEKETANQVKYWILRNEKKNTNTTQFINWNGNANGGTFNGWDDEGGNSQYSIHPVSVRNVSTTWINVNYHFKVQGGETYTVKVWQAEHSDFSVPAVSAQVTIVSKDCEGKRVSKENYEANIECTVTPLPFTVSTTGTPHYTYLLLNPTSQNDTWKIQEEDGRLKKVKAYSQGKFVQAELNQVMNDLWQVSGDPFNGFVFKNAATGKLLSADISGGNAGTPRLVADNEECDDVKLVRTWRLGYGQHGAAQQSQFALTPNKARASFINQSGANDAYSFGYWSADGGSTFFGSEAIIEVPMHQVDQQSYTTLCLPYDVTLAANESATQIYKAVRVTEHQLQCTPVTGVPAHAGVIIRNEANAPQVSLKVQSAPRMEGNLLVGTTTALPIEQLSDKLVFGRHDNVLGFYHAEGSAPLAANKAYLPATVAQSNKLTLHFGDSQVTAIHELTTAKTPKAPIYDLTGRQVERTVKGGLYIQNGKKFIAK